MAEEGGWQLIESDPGIFSSMLWDLGVQGVEVEELTALDPALLAELQPYAFIFLFKWRTASSAPGQAGELKEPAGTHYFAQQTITNACATLAILNALLNVRDPNVKLGEELTNLQSFSTELDPEMRGNVLTNSLRVREVHNSFARSDPFDMQEYLPDREKEDAYHFIAFTPIAGELYELDGLKPLPISHGPIPSIQSGFIERATEVIQNRIATYDDGELHFSLLAVVRDRIANLEGRIDALDATVSSSVNALTKEDAQTQLAQLHSTLEDERAKRARWSFENEMRRHNHIGFVHALLSKLAEKGKLEERVEAAKAAHERRATQRQASSK